METNPSQGLSLSVQSVSKNFGLTKALTQVTIEFVPGEIHAVIGENGAGKSTLMAAIGGFIKPDCGKILLGNTPIPYGSPAEVKKLGIRTVHQHFMLVPALTVAENFALTKITSRLNKLDITMATSEARSLSESLGWKLDFSAITGSLPVGTQQRVEILKALVGHTEVLILDEPTAVLSENEIYDLFTVLNAIKEQGKVVIIIAHKLSEIMTIADKISVLRQGELVATTPTHETSVAQLAQWMIGKVKEDLLTKTPSLGDVIVDVKNLTIKNNKGRNVVENIAFHVRRGEVFGIGGVDGNGQLELAECLVGLREASSGSMSLDGVVSFIPQDRQTDGLAVNMTIEENFVLRDRSNSLCWGPFIHPIKRHQHANKGIKEFNIKAEGPQTLVSKLSGGNQQKVVVCGVMDQNPDILVAMNPTRGLDFAAARFVHEKILERAQNGSAVVLFSTDLDELKLFANSMKFMSNGQLYEEFLIQ